MSYWFPISCMYLTFLLGLLLYKYRFTSSKHYETFRRLYVVCFFLTLVFYLTWGMIRA